MSSSYLSGCRDHHSCRIGCTFHLMILTDLNLNMNSLGLPMVKKNPSDISFICKLRKPKMNEQPTPKKNSSAHKRQSRSPTSYRTFK